MLCLFVTKERTIGLSVVFIVVYDALRAGDNASPPNNMRRALIFQVREL
jgi:hypothetical protein